MDFDLGRLSEYWDRMREEMDRLQQSLKEKTVEAVSGPVSVSANGHQEVVSVSLSQGYAEDRARLEASIKEAVNAALLRARQLVAEEMGRALGGDLGFLKERFIREP